MKSATLLAVTLLLLSGCATAPFSTTDTTPSVKEYTPEEQDKAASEMSGGSCPALNSMINDFMTMRDEARVAKEAL